MAPQDITRIDWLSDPQISPDGRQVAFVRTTLSEEKDEYLSTIWVVDLETANGSRSEPRQLTRGPKRDTAPRWSPDGSRISFVSEREEKKRGQLYVLPVCGGEALRLTDRKHGVSEPAWSPDGTHLAFVSKTGEESEPEEGKSKPARVITTLKYRFNGEGFVYDKRPHIFVVRADGTAEPRQVTDGDFADQSPAWSPDGRWIAFASARHETRDLDSAADVFVVAADGGEPRQVTRTRGPVRAPVFSPDGHSIAYQGHFDANDASARNALVIVVPTEGGESRALTESLDRTTPAVLGSVAARWSDDSRRLVFVVEDRGDQPVYRMHVQGGAAPERLTPGERWITGFSIAGGRMAFAASTPTMPAEIFIRDLNDSSERQITDLNRAWRSEVALSAPERYQVERDGVAIDAWVMKPHGFEPGKKYPVLLNIHGGPATQYGHTFFDEFQVYAGAGYAVVYTNPRGSHGYGEAFVRGSLGDWGGTDYQDVIAGLDRALERFDFLDATRLGVMGGSYGGYMTSWIVGHTDRFKAACSERALNDFWSFYGTADIGATFPEQQVRALPWEDPDKYLRQSPLFYAKNITTPLLIIHSEDDLRCPIAQGEQLYVALKKLGRTTTLIRFPDENHEMSRAGKPRHRLSRFAFILDWFGRYL